ncbi:MAG: efflux RND transporter periplasmic adaptor subunit [Gammaproteobacteria bacterium]|nr:MAG: efflux RND transporter periplasmic adaptor subunit [Gammaproteobacteria bacterium]
MDISMKIYAKLVLYFLLLLILSACGEDQTLQQEEQVLRSVKTQLVGSSQHGVTRTFSGSAKANQRSNLSFRVAGNMQSLKVEVGDRLQPGDVIATLDPFEYQLQAQEALANLTQAQATLRNAKSNFERTKGLYENNNISRNELDSARANAESSRAQVSAANKVLELARLNESYAKLKAVETCSVANTLAEVNEQVTAGQTIIEVTCGEGLDVELVVPESIIALLQRGMSASVSFSAIPDKQFIGKVTEVGVASSAGTTYPVTIALIDTTDGLRPGLAAQVSFTFEKAENQRNFIVPAVAVGKDVSGKYVYLVEKTEKENIGIIKRQAVTTGELTTTGLEIIEGVEEGDQVVTAGVNIVREGLEVLIN